jgi:hypothetical protein
LGQPRAMRSAILADNPVAAHIAPHPAPTAFSHPDFTVGSGFPPDLPTQAGNKAQGQARGLGRTHEKSFFPRTDLTAGRDLARSVPHPAPKASQPATALSGQAPVSLADLHYTPTDNPCQQSLLLSVAARRRSFPECPGKSLSVSGYETPPQPESESQGRIPVTGLSNTDGLW